MNLLGSKSQSHTHFADDGIPVLDGDINMRLDPTDLRDADTFEELTHNFNLFPALVRDQAFLDQLLDLPPGPEEPLAANQTSADDLETMSTVVIDHFPHSTTGTPIPGMACAQDSYQDMQSDLI
jgi:hypothetical protein